MLQYLLQFFRLCIPYFCYSFFSVSVRYSFFVSVRIQILKTKFDYVPFYIQIFVTVYSNFFFVFILQFYIKIFVTVYSNFFSFLFVFKYLLQFI